MVPAIIYAEKHETINFLVLIGQLALTKLFAKMLFVAVFHAQIHGERC